MSKAFLFITAIASCIKLAVRYFGFDFQDAWVFAWGTVGEAIVGNVLLYRLSVCELKLGSNHIAAFILVGLVLNGLLDFLKASLLPEFSVKSLNGPNAIVLALVVRYWREIPEHTRFSLFGFGLSNKSCEYLLAVQLAFSSFSAAIAAFQGVLIGLLFTFNIMYARAAHIPGFLIPAVRTSCTMASSLLYPGTYYNLSQSWATLDLRNIGSSAYSPSEPYTGSLQPALNVIPAAGRTDLGQFRVSNDEEAEIQRAIQLSLESSRTSAVPRH